MQSEYLIFNILVISGPVVAWIILQKSTPVIPIRILRAVLPVALIYIMWDGVVTGYFWYFNPRFVLGPAVLGVPFEEMLFFITVPVACLFLWVHWHHRISRDVMLPHAPRVLMIVVIAIAVVSVMYGWWYTLSVGVMGIITVTLDEVYKTHLLRDRSFLAYLLCVGLLTLVFNWYLTARPVVTYNPSVKSGLHILSIPVEDFLYGWTLVTLCCVLYAKRK